MPLSGQLSLDDHERPLEADIEFVGSELLVSTVAGPLGRWPIEDCLMEPDNGRFLITIDDETAWFVADDPVRLTRLMLEHWGSPNLATAVKAVRAATGPPPTFRQNRPIRDTEADTGVGSSIAGTLAGLDKRRKWQIVGLGLGLVVALVAATTIGRPDSTPVVSATVQVATTIPAIPAVFQTGLDGLAIRWNDAAGDLGTEAFLLNVTTANRLQTQLTGNMVLYGSEDPATDTVRTLMISAGPAFGEEATAILAVWGNLIVVVNPELGPEGRRAVLERLGIALNRSLTLGLDSETTEGGARYWLQSGVLNDRVLFGVQLTS